MKRNLLLVVLIAMSFMTMAQEVTVRFAGQLNGTLQCDLDSVVVSNTTRQWTVATTDTLIVLTPTVDIRQMGAVANMLGQNVPNPFECKTAVELSISQRENVRLQLVDAGGRICAEYNNSLEAGIHHFKISAASPQTYILNAKFSGKAYSIRMVNVGSCGSNYIRYEGVPGSIEAKLDIANEFELGDAMQYIGYTTLNSEAIASETVLRNQSEDETITLNFTACETIIGDTIAVVCDSFNWYEHTNITESGDYAHTFTAPNGCDSVVTLHLTINHCTGQLQNHTWVDLGLSVKWATTNVGATNPEDAGNYYAWGETDTKDAYTENNYTYRDNPVILPARADAATANWDNGWRMPTSAEMQELKDSCAWEWTTQNDVNGYLVTGPNGKSIFLPAAGYHYHSEIYDVGSSSFYWSSSLDSDDSDNAWQLYFRSDLLLMYADRRLYGHSVRAVCQVPVVETSDATDITATSATLNGNVIDNGGYEITAKGFVYGTDAENLSDTVAVPGETFRYELSGLNTGTRYYYMAFATNIIGTSYGTVKSFVADVPSSFVDARDGNTYLIITIGEQTWMAENLRYLPSVDGPATGSTYQSCYYVYGYDGTSVSEAKETENYATYGVLYNWSAAMNGASSSETNPSGVQGVCPDGWHLPSFSEWRQLYNALSGDNRGSQLAGNASLWESGSLTSVEEFGTSGFSALPGGGRSYDSEVGGTFEYMGSRAVLWSATLNYGDPYGALIQYNDKGIYFSSNDKDSGFGVRCVRNAANE